MRNPIYLLHVAVIAAFAFGYAPWADAQSAGSAVPSPQTAQADDPLAPKPVTSTAAHTSSNDGHQTKRILGIIPNFRSVSVDEELPPLSARSKFKLMLEDSFDYSDFIYVGILAGAGEVQKSYPEFHQGAAGYGRYYWHNFADTLDGNLMTESIVPTLTREDPRYYTLGHGGFLRRTGYSISRLFVTRTDAGGTCFNVSEIVGNGAAAGIANLYYPSQERTWTKTGQRWFAQVGLDGASNLLKEYWPFLNSKLFHGKY